jgi:hypothetical protein
MTFNVAYLNMDTERAAKIKAMLARGDRAEDIATWFGVQLYVVQMIQCGASHSLVPAAPSFALPPQGPYPLLRPAYEILDRIRAAEHELRIVSARLRQNWSCQTSSVSSR